MTTAIYVRNTRKGCRVEHPIKTDIIGRKKFRRFKTLGEYINDKEYLQLMVLRAELTLG